MARQIGSAAYADMFDMNTGTGFAPDAIEMSNAAYDEMFSAEAGYPQRPEQSLEQPTAPMEIYAARTKAEAENLNTRKEQAIAFATKEPQSAITTLKNQMRVKWEAIQRDSSLDADAKRKQGAALETQFEVQSIAINDKVAPALEQIQQAFEREQYELQMKDQRTQERGAYITQLEQERTITPEKAQSMKIKLYTGEDVSEVQIRGRQGPSVEQRKTAIEDDIRDITEFLKRFRKGGVKGIRWGDRVKYKDPAILDAAGKPVERDIDPSDPRSPDAHLLQTRGKWIQMLRRRQQEYNDLLIETDPVLGPAAQKQKDWAAATAALTKNGAKGGGVKEGLIKAKGKPTSRINVISPNGTTGTIEISEWGQYQLQGFKRAE